MTRKTQIIAGWAGTMSAIIALSIAMPAIGGKASQQRSQSVWTAIATDFLESDTRTLAFTATTAPELRDLQDIAPLTQFRAEHLRWADVRAAEHLCLSEAVYYEARSETRSGQLAVADVVKNRVASKHYPNTICGVIYQGAENPFACQFSFACDGSMDRAPKGKAWDHSQAIAQISLTGQLPDMTYNSTHYHTLSVAPVWSKTLEFKRRIGSHKFYRPSWRERNPAPATIAVAPPA